MLRGYRGIILAIGLILGAASQPPKADREKPTQSASQQVEQSLADMAASLREANKPSDLEQPCKEGDNKRSSDLCAQWKAADAARSAANATWLFGALGSLIGGFTLAAAWSAAKWARRAAEETKRTADLAELASKDSEAALTSALKSAEAAERQVSIAEDTAQRQLRAYVTVDHPYINNGPCEGIVLEYRITATNDGVTPAKDFQWASKFTIAFDEEAEEELKLPWDGVERSTAIVGAGKSVHMHGRLPSAITAEYQRRLEDGTARIWAVGEIRYQDIFGQACHTQYRGYYDFMRGFVWDVSGNEAT